MSEEHTQPLNISLEEIAEIWVGILLSHSLSKKMAELQKKTEGEKDK